MRLFRPLCLLALASSILVFQGCGRYNPAAIGEVDSPELWQPHLKQIDSKDLSAYPRHGRAYVPVYSHIYTEGRDSVLNLAETVSVRNTDDVNPIVIDSVRYQSTTGKSIREYVSKPVLLEPMATADFVVRLDDTSGGSGASFIVEWQGTKTVNPPLIEAIMISTGSGRNLSFVCRAVEMPPAKPGAARIEDKPEIKTESKIDSKSEAESASTRASDTNP
ncbi:MAG: DUF3124 domain-containing protein [Candidatus Melainabacteria bacterium]|nr:DUF3124 domain-containing protein [Candidatus Melainabacteria bacterium]